MGLIDELHGSLTAWDTHRIELAALSINRGDDWRRQTVQYRRLLQKDIARMADAIGAIIAVPATAEAGREFRGSLSALRSCVAEHQANWPVIAIDPDDANYDRSVKNLRAGNDRFLSGSKALLRRIQDDM